ncbi:hypothetical protein pb186bvf_019107 [Paramecium bursaria]
MGSSSFLKNHFINPKSAILNYFILDNQNFSWCQISIKSMIIEVAHREKYAKGQHGKMRRIYQRCNKIEQLNGLEDQFWLNRRFLIQLNTTTTKNRQIQQQGKQVSFIQIYANPKYTNLVFNIDIDGMQQKYSIPENFLENIRILRYYKYNESQDWNYQIFRI